jgi:uncharacterized protein (DUF2062 family)
MKSEHKAALKAATPFGLIGAGALVFLGNPVAWAVLAYSTYRVGKVAYEEEQLRGRLRQSGKDYDLFI